MDAENHSVCWSLLDDLEEVDWPESIKEMQRNWIGRSVGANVTFKVAGMKKTLPSFPTRPDTLFGATYAVLAPEHELVAQITTSELKAAIDAYVEEASKNLIWTEQIWPKKKLVSSQRCLCHQSREW